MTAQASPHVVLYDLGISTADLIAAMSKAQMRVTVIEPDPSDADRVHDVLGRRVPGGRFTVSTQMVERCDLFLCHASDAQMAPATALIAVLDGPQALATVPDPARSIAMDVLDPRFAEVAFGDASPDARIKATGFLEHLQARYATTTRMHDFGGHQLQDAAISLLDRLLLVGITPWELDEALEDAGFAQGVLKAQDHIGLDVAFARRRASGTDLLVADRMVHEGRLGRSVGVGWYRYPGGGGAVIDPLMEDMIIEEARFAGIDPIPMTEAAAADAVIAGVINASAGLLQDGLTLEGLDLLALYKLGLPDLTARARQMGETNLRDRLAKLEDVDATLWQPSPLLGLIFDD
ncbi:3-hydroxyacyl-CoA dehydrogenase family protein [Sulfitobacter sp.]|uniref:3-hydroxyacyl-CoA dehydrogenase family protein n=1 Tax=Sulfitobacter sp. TaxID=1903071 RepID=UPI0035650F0F